MNLISFLRKKYTKPFVGALFAFVFLFSFFSTTGKAEAQLYDSYKNLFKGNDPAPSLNFVSLVKKDPTDATKLVFDFKFNLQASFDLNVGGSAPKDWHWNHIRDFDNPNVFILRVCNADATGEGACLFSVIPYASKASTDQDLKNLVCKNGTCTLPTEGGVWPKIYHYKAKASGPNLIYVDEQFHRFNVTFDVKDLAFLKDGKLDTPETLASLFKIGSKDTWKADAWYCSGIVSGEPLPTEDGSDPDIRQFKKICGDGHPYFKIATSGTFKMPQTVDEGLGQTPATDPNIGTAMETDTLPVCGVTYFSDGSLMGCVARVVYYVFYWPIAWVAGILGKVFDFFLGYSLSDESYRAAIIVTGWKLVRDISNIFFIIILIWTGLATVFNISSISMKKIVPAVIINALLINFSLFGTQVVIDISNITARLFYNTMAVCDGECRYIETSKGKIIENPSTDTVGGYKSLSSKIVSSFNPQRVFSTTSLDDGAALKKEKPAEGSQSATVGGLNSQAADENLSNASTKSRYSSDYAGYFIVITLIAAFIMFAIAKMFFGVMFMFVGRVVGLYLTMIFSPFAVLTRGNMPIVGGIKDLAWENWKKELFEYALLAPIFVFFLYIIYAFINSDMTKVFLSSNNSAGFMETVLTIAIPMIIIYTLIGYGVGLAKKYAGKAGEMLQSLGSKAVGMATGAAVGVATGGAALAGRGATSLLNKGVGTWAAANKDSNVLAGGVNKFLQWGQKSSFDIRNTKLGEGFNKGVAGLGIKQEDKVSSFVGLGQKDYLGGNVKIRKDREKEKEERATKKNDMSHLTDKQAQDVWDRRTKKQTEKEADEVWAKGELDKRKNADPTFKALEKVAERLEADLKTAVESKNTTNEKIIREQLATNKKERDQIVAMTMTPSIEAAIKDKSHQETKEYKDALKSAQDDSKKKYGEVKSAEDLSKAMRYEYAQRMLQDSLTLSEKEKRKGLSQTGGIVATALSQLIPGVGLSAAVVGGLVGNYIDSQQEADKRVFEKIVKDFEKSKNKDTKLGRLKTKLKEVDDLIDGHIRTVLGRAVDASLSDLTDDQKTEHFNKARSDAQTAADIAEDEYKEAREKYKRTKLQSDLDEMNRRSTERQRTKDELNDLNNAQKNKDSIKDNIEEEERKAKEQDDKKDKKKDDGKKSGEEK